MGIRVQKSKFFRKIWTKISPFLQGKQLEVKQPRPEGLREQFFTFFLVSFGINLDRRWYIQAHIPSCKSMNDPQNHRNSSMDNCTKKNSFHRSIDWFWNSFSFAGNAHLHHHSRLSYYPFPHFLRASIIVYSWCMNYLDGSSTDFKSLHANDFWAQTTQSCHCWCQEEIDLQCWLYSFRLYNELNQIQNNWNEELEALN